MSATLCCGAVSLLPVGEAFGSVAIRCSIAQDPEHDIQMLLKCRAPGETRLNYTVEVSPHGGALPKQLVARMHTGVRALES